MGSIFPTLMISCFYSSPCTALPSGNLSRLHQEVTTFILKSCAGLCTVSSVLLAQTQEWPHSGCSVLDQEPCRAQKILSEPNSHRVKGQVKARRLEREGKGFHQSHKVGSVPCIIQCTGTCSWISACSRCGQDQRMQKDCWESSGISWESSGISWAHVNLPPTTQTIPGLLDPQSKAVLEAQFGASYQSSDPKKQKLLFAQDNSFRKSLSP